MKISDLTFDLEDKKRVRSDLIRLLNQPSDTVERPCPGCRYRRPENQSLSSAKYCSYRCPAAPAQMSSEPEKYPIEGRAVPIVYAFYTTRLMVPCWSCEGHLNASGGLAKVPKVWFYTTSDLYSKLVAQYVNYLKGQHRISSEWIVRVLPFSQSLYTMTYSLEPAQDSDNLAALQDDFLTIARGLRKELRKTAQDYIDRIDKSPFAQR